MSTRPAGPRRPLASSPFNAPVDDRPVVVYEVGERVTHDRHGLGRVVGIESETAVLVDFATGVRRVTLPSTMLSKL